MMQSHLTRVRSALAIFVVLATPALLAGTAFPLGTGEIGPREASHFDIARTRTGSIAAWTLNGSRELHITRLDEDGALVARSAVPLRGSHLQIASTGREAILVESAFWSYETFVRTVAGDAVSESQRVPIVASSVLELEWTGNAYALLFRDSDWTFSMALLDRDGALIGGVLHFASMGVYARPRLACGDDRCLVAFADTDPARVAVINEADFPPVGQRARAAIFTLPLPGRMRAVGYDHDLGFYTLTDQELRRHGRLRTLSGGLFNPHRRVVLPQPLVYDSDVLTAAHAGTLYVAEASGDDGATTLRRITQGGRVEKLRVTPDVHWRAPRQLIVHDSVDLVWQNDLTLAHYLSRIGESGLLQPGAPASAGPARGIMPRIARGTATSLVTWVEAFASHESLYAAIVDADGRPVTTPARIARTDVVLSRDTPFRDVVVAFDGVNFLVLWQAHTYNVFGQMISQDGQLAGGQITLQAAFTPMTLTLVWTGSEYWTTGDGRVVRISPAGVLLPRLDSLDGEDNMLLVRDENGRLRGLSLEYTSSIVSAGPAFWINHTWVDIEDGNSECERSGPYPKRLDNNGKRGGPYAPSITAAVAFGGGHRLAILDTSFFSPGALLDFESGAVLPYPIPSYPGHEARLDAHWNGREFIVFAGKILARHTPEGEVRTLLLGEDVNDSAGLPDGPDAVLVVKEREAMMEVERIVLPLP